MRIGQWRERIILQKSYPDVDRNGNHILSWQEYFKCAAYVNNLTGKEYWAAAQVNAQTELYFIIRFCSEIKVLNSEQYRILFRDQIYNITFIDNVQYQNKMMKIRASLVKR